MMWSYIPPPGHITYTYLEEVLGGLQKVGMMATPKKCHLGLTKALYLVYHIGHGLLMSQEKKVEG